jgi:hypothetical protein
MHRYIEHTYIVRDDGYLTICERTHHRALYFCVLGSVVSART